MDTNTTPKLKNVTTCFPVSPKMASRGAIVDKAEILTAALPLLELQICLILFLGQTLHFLLKRLKISVFVSQALAGLILGPAFLGRYDVVRNVIFPYDGQNTLETAANLGMSMFFFLTGVKMDVGMLPRIGRKAAIIGTVSMVVPLVFGVGIRGFFVQGDERSLHFSVMQSLTSFPVIAYHIYELKLTNSELGHLGLSSALVGELTSLSVGLLFPFGKSGGKDYSEAELERDPIAMVAFFIVVIFILRPLMLWVIKRAPAGSPVPSSTICLIMGVALGCQLYFKVFNKGQYLGPFIFGLAVPAGPPLGSTIVDKLEVVVSAFLLPLFVAVSMMRADFRLVIPHLWAAEKFMCMAFLIMSVKLVACFIPSLFCNIPKIDALILALILNCKGIVELGISATLLDLQMISESSFVSETLWILIVTITVPILVNSLYDPSRKYAGYQARNIISIKPDDEFRILACIHRPDNVSCVIKLLNVLCPTKESPISVYSLHLIELVGRTTPLFWSHRKQTRLPDICEHVVSSFDSYERNNWGIVSVQNFTAISPHRLMYEDICNIVLQKTTSLVLIPFHRTWSIDGSVLRENNDLRALNFRVLEKAPCSVGIFFERGKVVRRPLISNERSGKTVSVCVMYFGGKDDREALSLAKRMAKDSRASLTVVRFLPEKLKGEDVFGDSAEDNLLDSQELKDVQENTMGNGYVLYIEHKVSDGLQTEKIISSMPEEFDLFVVGRRSGVKCPQTTGLSDWSEFPELGVMGDLLACKDFNIQGSVLIVQQQIQMK